MSTPMFASYQPNIAIHPGRTLRGMLEALNMSQVELSERAGLTIKTINEIVQEKNPITLETAIKFASVFNTSSVFWNNLQRNYEATQARIQEREILEKESQHLKRFSCYHEIAREEFVPAKGDSITKTRALLGFFGVSSLELVPSVQAVAFRKTGHSESSKESLAAWLRCGELKARAIETKPFDYLKLSDSLEDFRQLTNMPAENLAKALIDRCASLGIALVVMPHFANTGVNASTRWLAPDRALIQLTLRWRYSDIFWFNFFHEIGHLLKHGKKEEFVEFEHQTSNDKESEANSFAQNTLIPQEAYAAFKSRGLFDAPNIKSFASKVGISPSIIAGRLARETANWKAFSSLRTKFEFVGE